MSTLTQRTKKQEKLKLKLEEMYDKHFDILIKNISEQINDSFSSLDITEDQKDDCLEWLKRGKYRSQEGIMMLTKSLEYPKYEQMDI